MIGAPLLCVCANLPSELGKRQLEPHICFCIQSVIISHGMQPLENFTVNSRGNEGGEKATVSESYYESVLSQGPLERVS